MPTIKTLKNPTKILQKLGSPSLSSAYCDHRLSHFKTPNGIVPYTQIHGQNRYYVPSDPLCQTKNLAPLLSEFLDSHPRTCFGHIHRATCDILTSHHFYAKQIGHENTLDIQTFSPTWQSHKGLKGLINAAQKNKIHVQEITHDLAPYHTQLQHINTQWYRRKRSLKHNQQFLLLPNEHAFLHNSRIFAAFHNQTLIAYQTYHPLYESQACTGYENTQCRYTTTPPRGTNDLIRWTAIQTFQKEGHTHLRLGLSPNPHFSRFQKFSSPFYNHKGAALYKERYHAKPTPIYFATNTPFPWLDKLRITGLTLGLLRIKVKN